jgi:hypothetical protein
VARGVGAASRGAPRRGSAPILGVGAEGDASERHFHDDAEEVEGLTDARPEERWAVLIMAKSDGGNPSRVDEDMGSGRMDGTMQQERRRWSWQAGMSTWRRLPVRMAMWSERPAWACPHALAHAR